jgi:UDP-perosamine 4-acetyltransferase
VSDHDKPVVIISGGSHASVLIESAHQNLKRVAGYVDIKDKGLIMGVPWLGTDEEFRQQADRHAYRLLIGLGMTKGSSVRRDWYDAWLSLGFEFDTLIDSTAIVADSAVVGSGAQLLAGSVVQSNAVIGTNSIVNTRAVVEHDCMVGNHSHIATGSILCGGVKVGECVHIGAGAVVLQGISIGREATVGAGAVVTKDVPERTVVAGIPAKRLCK